MSRDFYKQSKKTKLDNRSKYLRKLVLECLFGGDRGHMGSAMSLIEILRVLYDKVLKFDPQNPLNSKRDRLILSKGHAAIGVYAVMNHFKILSNKDFKSFCEFNSKLGGHPDSVKLPGLN